MADAMCVEWNGATTNSPLIFAVLVPNDPRENLDRNLLACYIARSGRAYGVPL